MQPTYQDIPEIPLLKQGTSSLYQKMFATMDDNVKLWGHLPLAPENLAPIWVHVATVGTEFRIVLKERHFDKVAFLRLVAFDMIGSDVYLYTDENCSIPADLTLDLPDSDATYYFKPKNDKRVYPTYIFDILRPFSSPDTGGLKRFLFYEDEDEDDTDYSTSRYSDVGSTTSRDNLSNVIERDGNVCSWTKLRYPERCHIIPHKRTHIFSAIHSHRNGKKTLEIGSRLAGNYISLNKSIHMEWDRYRILMVNLPNVAFEIDKKVKDADYTFVKESVTRINPIIAMRDEDNRKRYYRVLPEGESLRFRDNLDPPDAICLSYNKGCVLSYLIGTKSFAKYSLSWHRNYVLQVQTLLKRRSEESGSPKGKSRKIGGRDSGIIGASGVDNEEDEPCGTTHLTVPATGSKDNKYSGLASLRKRISRNLSFSKKGKES